MVYKASSHPKYDSNVLTIQNNLNALQEKLSMSMWPHIKADGFYGTQTAEAVKYFQMAYKCSPYDGIYGPSTDAVLKSALTKAEIAYHSVPVSSASINKASVPSPVFPGNDTVPKTLITSNTNYDYSQFTSFKPGITVPNNKTVTINKEQAHKMLNATLSAWAPVQTGLDKGVEKMAENLKKYNNMTFYEKWFYKAKIADEVKSKLDSALRQGASEADSTLIKQLKQASGEAYKRYATINDYSVPQVKEEMRKNLDAIQSETKKRAKTHAKQATQILTEDINNNNLSESGTLSRIKSKFNFKGAVKWVGRSANILAFHEAIDMFISGPDPKDPEWNNKFKTKIFEGIDSLILGFISSLIADLIIMGAVAAGLCEAVGALVAFLISAIVGAVLGIVYLIVKDEDTKPFSQWVVDLIPQELIHEVYGVKYEALGNHSIGTAALIDQRTHPF